MIRITVSASVLILITAALGSPKVTLRPDGMGQVRIGMTLRALNTLLRDKMEASNDPDEQHCYLTFPARYPKVEFMVEDGKLSRIALSQPGIPTAEGIQVGDSEARAKQVYGRKLKIEESKYDEEGHYLTVFTPDKKYGFRFTTHKGKIVEIYGGRAESIQYVEDCL